MDFFSLFPPKVQDEFFKKINLYVYLLNYSLYVHSIISVFWSDTSSSVSETDLVALALPSS